jgi:hypothetical protein
MAEILIFTTPLKLIFSRGAENAKAPTFRPFSDVQTHFQHINGIGGQARRLWPLAAEDARTHSTAKLSASEPR